MLLNKETDVVSVFKDIYIYIYPHKINNFFARSKTHLQNMAANEKKEDAFFVTI